MAEYYAQRASEGGFLIGEATIAAPNGNGYLGAPGLYDDSQIAGWKQRHRRRARQGRPHLPAAVSRRTPVQQPVAAGRRPAGRTVGRAAWRRRLHRSRLDPEYAEPRADHRRDRRSGRELPHRRHARQGSRLRRRRTACRQWLPVRSVPAGRQQQAHRYLRRLVRKPRALPDRGHAGRHLGVGQRTRCRAPWPERHVGRYVGQQSGRPLRVRGGGTGQTEPGLSAPDRAARARQRRRRQQGPEPGRRATDPQALQGHASSPPAASRATRPKPSCRQATPTWSPLAATSSPTRICPNACAFSCR